jgi:hypothetical protein
MLSFWESIESTVAYAVGATHWSTRNQMVLRLALWGFTVPLKLIAISGEWDAGGQGEESNDEVQKGCGGSEGEGVLG